VSIVKKNSSLGKVWNKGVQGGSNLNLLFIFGHLPNLEARSKTNPNLPYVFLGHFYYNFLKYFSKFSNLRFWKGQSLALIETCHVSIVFIDEQQSKGNVFVVKNQQNQG